MDNSGRIFRGMGIPSPYIVPVLKAFIVKDLDGIKAFNAFVVVFYTLHLACGLFIRSGINIKNNRGPV